MVRLTDCSDHPPTLPRSTTIAANRPRRTDDHPGTHALTERIIGGAFRVANVLGTGFLETVYTNALAHELRRSGLAVTVGPRLLVRYEGVIVGAFIADLIVED